MDRRADYHFPLPRELIAQTPAERRDGSRLLVLQPDGALDDRMFADLPALLPKDALLVVNDTRVFPARLRTRKPSGGAVELLFMERVDGPDDDDDGPAERWRCMARSSKKLRPGTDLWVLGRPGDTHDPAQTDAEDTGLRVRVVSERAPDSTVIVQVQGPAHDLLDAHGDLPLPPYIERPDGTSTRDAERYQTVYARERGAIAAPTAGLHFTQAMMDQLRAAGVELATLTLHVGLGTFAPMRAERLDEHVMHEERYEIAPETARRLADARASGRPIVAVGTTCVRALESAARRADRGQLVAPGRASTDLFITPGFEFQVVDHLITNFHLPESTLLMLVCAFAGYDPIMAAYHHAVASHYRFFSYGDAMLLCRAD